MSDVREGKVETGAAPLAGGLVGQLIPFLIIAVTALWVRRRQFELPERMPIHWNAAGQANGFIPREQLTAPLWFTFALCALLLVVAVLIQKYSPRGELQPRVLRVMLAVEIFIAAIGSSVVLSSVSASPMPSIVIAVAGVLVLLGFCIANFSGLPRERRNPSAWRGGLYSDAEDPALFVPRQYGGYTINLAHPRAKPVLAALILLPVGAVVAALLLH